MCLQFGGRGPAADVGAFVHTWLRGTQARYNGKLAVDTTDDESAVAGFQLWFD